MRCRALGMDADRAGEGNRMEKWILFEAGKRNTRAGGRGWEISSKRNTGTGHRFGSSVVAGIR